MARQARGWCGAGAGWAPAPYDVKLWDIGNEPYGVGNWGAPI